LTAKAISLYASLRIERNTLKDQVFQNKMNEIKFLGRGGQGLVMALGGAQKRSGTNSDPAKK